MIPVEAASREDRQRSIELAQIPTGAGDHDQQLSSSLGVQLSNARIVKGSYRLGRTPQCTLTIRDHGDGPGITGDAPRGAKLSQRFGPLLGVIRSDAHRFSDRADAGGSGPGSPCMRQGPFRIVIKELGRHHQVSAHRVGIRLGQRAQFGANRPAQGRGIYVVG